MLNHAADPDGDPLSVTAAGPVSAQDGAVALLGTTILYNPPAGFAGTDMFPVTLSDSHGGTITGAVTVTVGPPPDQGSVGTNPPRLNHLPDGTVELKFQGIPGRTCRVQRTTDLTTWTTLAVIPAGPDGEVAYTDESPPQPSAY